MITAFEPDSPSRHFSASIRVSAARSSWSRERLSSAITLGVVSRATPARYFSSTSITPYCASEPLTRAEVMPAGMLAPSAFDTTGPHGPQCLGDQPGRGRLAVGRRHQDHVQVLCQPPEQVGVELERHPAADHRSAAPPGCPRHRRSGLARRHGQLGPRRQRLRVACHRPRSSLHRSAPSLSMSGAAEARRHRSGRGVPVECGARDVPPARKTRGRAAQGVRFLAAREA